MVNADLDSKTLNLIQSAIDAGWVSVFYDPSGQIKEYNTTILDNLTLCAEKCPASSIGNVQYYDYTIYIDDNIVANATIATPQKFYTEKEQNILNIFNRMSQKVILQEMATTNLRKTYDA